MALSNPGLVSDRDNATVTRLLGSTAYRVIPFMDYRLSCLSRSSL